MNAPAGQVWAWGAVALLCSAALLWVNPWRGSFRDGVLVLGRQLWLLVVPAAISVGDLLRGGGYFPAFGWGRPLQGAVELGARTLGWLVLSDVPGLVLAACLAFGLPGWREGWRSGLDGYVPAVRRLADGLVAVGSAALIWLWWVGTGAGMPGRVVAVLAVPLVALGMVVMAERWRMGLASPTPVGWADGWRQSVFLGLRDGVRLLVAAVVTGLAVCLPMPWPLLVLGIGAAALAAGRWREHGAGGIAAWAAWVCVGAAWVLSLEVLLALGGEGVPPVLSVVVTVLRTALVVVLFAALVGIGPKLECGEEPPTLRIRAGRTGAGRARGSGRLPRTRR